MPYTPAARIHAAIAARAAQLAAEAAQASDTAPQADPSPLGCLPPGEGRAAPGSRFRGNDERGRGDGSGNEEGDPSFRWDDEGGRGDGSGNEEGDPSFRRDDANCGDDEAGGGDHHRHPHHIARDPVANLPALIEQLPNDDPRKPQVEFTRAARVVFLEALAVVGSVRSAARRARVSHQTVYRARRACPDFRRCWDAALVQALAQAEDVLASRAIDGVEESVFYHGEEIARRRRYDPRLLLAHIGRLDKLAARAEVVALSDRFDEALEAFAEGGDLPEPPGDFSSPGQCNTRSTPDGNRPEVPPCEDCGGACNDPEALLTEADCMWLGNRLDRMEAARPDDAPTISSLATALCDTGEVEALQLEAFEAGEPEWWLQPRDEEDGEDEWLRLPEDSPETRV